MNEVIWLFGSSTAGKKTLITRILADPDKFRGDLDITNENIKANKEALELVTKKNHIERLGLIDKIGEDLKDERDVTVLIKGQAFDLKNDLINKLAEAIPDIKQRIIFVYTDPQEELGRIKMHRAWYTPDITEEYIIDEVNYQLSFLEQYKSQGISIICVDGGSRGKYRIISLPRIIKAV
jgi:hypothetical protein